MKNPEDFTPTMTPKKPMSPPTPAPILPASQVAIDAFKTVCTALEPLSPQHRERVVHAAAILLQISFPLPL